MPGIYIDFKENQIGKQWLCTLCLFLLRAPVQTVCGHRCCQSCVKEKKGSSDSFVCPEDGTLVSEVFPDRFVEREVLNLIVCCIHKRSGCDWKGLVKNYEAHVKSCNFEDVTCPNDGCLVSLKRGALEKHLSSECNFRNVICQACGDSVSHASLKKHHRTDCPASSVKCNQCGKDVVRAQLRGHQETECDEAVSMCNFTKIGCGAKRLMKKNDRRKHMESASLNHLTYLLNHTFDLEKQIAQLREDMPEAKRIGAQMREPDLLLEEVTEVFKEPARRLKGGAVTQLADLESTKKAQRFASIVKPPPDIPSMYANIKEMTCSDSAPFEDFKALGAKAKSLPYEINKPSSEPSMTKELKEFDNRLQALGIAIEDCQTQQKQIQDTIKDFDDSNRRIDAFRDLLRRLENRVASLESAQALKDVSILEQNERLGFLEDVSYDATMIWPVTSFMKQRHASIVGKNVSIYSPHFYSSRYGYKMRLRVYLNGDGIGKGSHISLFFVICKGKYDSLLSWPFRQKVTMTILDQDHMKDVADSFKPDPTSSSFQKPKNAMNIASGCPLFMPIAQLDTHAYIRDDTMYIKVEIDRTGLK